MRRRGTIQIQFYEEIKQVFHHLPKYHMKILLGNFYEKVRIENIFKPKIGDWSLHEDTDDNCVE